MTQIEEFEEILSAIDLEQLLILARKIILVKSRKHGEVSLLIKNGEIVYINIRVSEDMRKNNRKMLAH